MFRGIYSSADQQMLQKDIDKLAQWSATYVVNAVLPD